MMVAYGIGTHYLYDAECNCIVKEFPERKNIRLKNYDYSSAGYYFVTICVKDWHMMLGDVVGAASCRPQLTDIGSIVETEISTLSRTYANVEINKYVIMPNHVHMIVCIFNDVDVCGSGRQNSAPTLSQIIGQWEREVSINVGFSLWQKSFHDHIIRSEAEYQRISQYIDENPARWAEDEYYT